MGKLTKNKTKVLFWDTRDKPRPIMNKKILFVFCLKNNNFCEMGNPFLESDTSSGESQFFF